MRHEEVPLAGGNAGGAVLVDGKVCRPSGPWTPAVHSLLRHLHDRGFERAPQSLGYDDAGREVLTYLPGETVGSTKPWPGWVHADSTLPDVAGWLRDYHAAVADFVPADGCMWRMGDVWQPGQLICHNDAAPYNAAWLGGRLTGFFDWDFAGPAAPEWDLAFTVFSWVPLHARSVVAREGFCAFNDRARRLDMFLRAYGWAGNVGDLLAVLDRRLEVHVAGLRRLADAGDPLFQRLVAQGAADDLQRAREELARGL